MRNVKWLVAAALVTSTAGCVESVNQGYGYNGGYGYNNGYSVTAIRAAIIRRAAATTPDRPRVNNYYYNPQPTVVTQTRYVPVPTRCRRSRPTARTTIAGVAGTTTITSATSRRVPIGRTTRRRRRTTTIRTRLRRAQAAAIAATATGIATATASPTAGADFHL